MTAITKLYVAYIQLF